MRGFLQTLYSIVLKGIGALGLLVVFVFLMIAFTGDDPRTFDHPLPIMLMAILLVSSIALTYFQARLPGWLVRPSRPWHSGMIFAAFGLLGLANMIAVMLPLTSIGLYLKMDDNAMRPLTINSTLLFGTLYGFATLIGVILSLVPARAGQAREYA